MNIIYFGMKLSKHFNIVTWIYTDNVVQAFYRVLEQGISNSIYLSSLLFPVGKNIQLHDKPLW